MTRPYKDGSRFGGGGYIVDGIGRPNRTAAGMFATRLRSRRYRKHAPVPLSRSEPTERLDPHAEAVLRLVVWGTTAKGIGMTFRTTRKQVPCACCGSPVGRLRLNEQGLNRLAILRRRKQERTACAKP